MLNIHERVQMVERSKDGPLPSSAVSGVASICEENQYRKEK